MVGKGNPKLPKCWCTEGKLVVIRSLIDRIDSRVSDPDKKKEAHSYPTSFIHFPLLRYNRMGFLVKSFRVSLKKTRGIRLLTFGIDDLLKKFLTTQSTKELIGHKTHKQKINIKGIRSLKLNSSNKQWLRISYRNIISILPVSLD